MSSYILSGPVGEDLDEETFEEFLQDWQKRSVNPRSARVVDKVLCEYFTVWSRNKERIFLSLRVVPKRRIRNATVAYYVIGLIASEVLTFLLPTFVSRAAHLSTPLTILGVLDVVLLLALAVFGPTIILTHNGKLCSLEEQRLKELLKQHGIEASPLTPSAHWILFPGDKYILTGATLISILLQILVHFQALEIFRPLLPLLLFLLALFLVFFIHSLAYKAIRDAAHLLYYRKLKVTGLAMTTVLTFALPIFFFTVSYALATVSISLLQIDSPAAFSFHKLFSFDAFTAYPYGIGPNDVIVVSAYYTWWGVWDSFHRQLWQLLFYAAWGAPLVFLLCSILAIRYLGLFNVKLWDSDLKPSSKKQIAHKSAKKSIDIVILLEWLIMTVIKFIGVGLAVVGFLTTFHLSFSEGKPLPLLLPFVWFEASFQVVMGTLVGTTIARIVLTLIFLPAVLWLLLWFQSLCYKCALSLYYLYSRKKNRGEAQKTARELSSTLHVPAPIISIENTKAPFPVTTFLFPKHCVIHISPVLIDVLKQKPNDLRLMLAHELGHVVKHSTRIWWAQIVSFLSLNGVGFLPLLFNYWRMETEADEYALQVTKDRQELISLLERLDNIEFEVTLKRGDRAKTGREEGQRATTFYHRLIENKLVGQVIAAYNLYFAINLWGAAHPDTQERVDNLRIYNRLSKGTNMVIEYAKEEVKNEQIKGLRFRSIAPHHLLLGLLRELNLPNLPIDKVRSAIVDAFEDASEDTPRYLGKSSAASQIEFHPETRQILAHAADLADTMSHQCIEPEHLWLGLLGKQDTVAAYAFANLDVDLKEINIAILDKLVQHETKAQDNQQETPQSHATQGIDGALTVVSHPPEEKHISRILVTTLLVIITAIVLIPLGYSAYLSKITPTPTAPPSIRAVPTLPPQNGGGLDLNSPRIQNSIAELQKLYPYLPYYKDITLSTGVSVTINIPEKVLQLTPWTLDAEIYGINYETSPNQADYTLMKKSFLEAANIVFAWVKQHGADPKKIIYTWGTRAYIQQQAEQWLSE